MSACVTTGTTVTIAMVTASAQHITVVAQVVVSMVA